MNELSNPAPSIDERQSGATLERMRLRDEEYMDDERFIKNIEAMKDYVQKFRHPHTSIILEFLDLTAEAYKAPDSENAADASELAAIILARFKWVLSCLNKKLLHPRLVIAINNCESYLKWIRAESFSKKEENKIT